MGKDKVEKKDRAEKKEKRAEKDGVHKVKKEKKEKKDKTALVDAVEKEIDSEAMEGLEQTGAVAVKGEGEVDAAVDRPVGALVPFANPLVEDKQAKKVLKSVKKVRMVDFHRIFGSPMSTDRMVAQLFFLISRTSMLTFPLLAAVNKSLKRGVKEVVKALRKSPIPAANAAIGVPSGVVVLAADISPMDVISHIPVLCEDHGIPYVFVTSRAELGASAATKRPTSVVMVTPKAAKGKKEDDEEFTKVFEELAGLTQKELKKLTV
ncbi:Ribosomal protein L7Ae/L30e/S12e/Gadd45 [Penicillium expansum]|uniref:Ribosomal protein L7Ae/L30e/S12e/Gadd45 n=1 Tax=Penicillium expansum TaxID=27334 RepID=A0A0A2JM66_PENEN|nr:Ribosomal protein L7Ae/L30e/S12e/Gadd45 [Penicillium expansum]KGO46708.1 Ribosomal protein L7Ae/L30e/S12e/Gadd45 [Penicillium expansum]KGO53375.1 Ribosomal protein L7Ae/L30e/S12e/Gadd45 [Penicillium expansum]KGO53441.1 Ribosomal protein L7Ae/L30e/S12e/Gadd45 [Penicillium expansum]